MTPYLDTCLWLSIEIYRYISLSTEIYRYLSLSIAIYRYLSKQDRKSTRLNSSHT